jgi:hypothetical protein
MVHADAVACWLMLQHYCLVKGIRHGLVNSKCSLVEVGRNNLVAAAQQIEATHLLFLDSDMMVPPQTLERLMSHGKDIVGATYTKRRGPFDLTHRELDGSAGQIGQPGLREVSRIATGCLLINMKVFEKLTKPYFPVMWSPQGECISEDNVFCDRAREQGFGVWLDIDLSQEVQHLGQYSYRLEDAVIEKPRIKLVNYG